MSYASNIKSNLIHIIPSGRHDKIAEITAMIMHIGKVMRDDNGDYILEIMSERSSIARKGFTLLKKTFNIDGVRVKSKGDNIKHRSYRLVCDAKSSHIISKGCQILIGTRGALSLEDKVLSRKSQIKSYIRGAFISCGSISDPEKSYHLEFVCHTSQVAKILKDMIGTFDIRAGHITRKNAHIIYIKDSDDIAQLLGIMGDASSMMDIENIKILRDMRNDVNRRVNCETANIGKTIAASMKLCEDIRYIDKKVGIDTLSDALAKAAKARLRYPDDSIEKLGKRLDPPVSKNGMNHRLRKISEHADMLRR